MEIDNDLKKYFLIKSYSNTLKQFDSDCKTDSFNHLIDPDLCVKGIHSSIVNSDFVSHRDNWKKFTQCFAINLSPQHQTSFDKIISILLDLIEYKLTSNTEDDENQFENIFINNNGDYASVKILYITFTDVINLYKKFQMIISEIVPSKSLKSEEDKMLDRQILKSITDAVFMKLSVGKYKENCHSQSVYSFIQDNSLDNIARKMGMKQSNCKRTSAEIQHI